jgi:hypothetical protein
VQCHVQRVVRIAGARIGVVGEVAVVLERVPTGVLVDRVQMRVELVEQPLEVGRVEQ